MWWNMVKHDEIRWNVMKYNEIKIFSPAHTVCVLMHKRTERRYSSTNWCWNLFHAHVTHQHEWTWCHDVKMLELIKLMVHPKHEERIEREPMQRICQSLVNIQCIYKNLICKSLQHFPVIQSWTRQSCGDMSPKKTHVLWALHGRQIDINFAQSSPTQSMKAKTWVPTKICLIQFWKVNILQSQRFGGLVWLVQMIFRISLWMVFWGFQPLIVMDVCLVWVCFTWVIINDPRFESWRFQ